MDVCSVTLPDLPNVSIVDKLKSSYPNDNARLVSTIQLMMNNDKTDFSVGFNEFYKIINSVDVNPNFNTTDETEANKIVETAIKYVNKVIPRISNKNITDRDTTTQALYNYSNTAARDEGKNHVSHIILDAFKKVKFDGILIEGNQIEYYLQKVRATINGYIFKNVSAKNNKTLTEIKKGFAEAENKRDYINELLGKDNKTPIAQNLYALWLELNANPEHTLKYINDLFNDPILNKVLDDTSRDLDELNDLENYESNEALNGVSEFDVEGAIVDLDDSFAAFDHSGIKTDFNKHVSDVVTVYFNTLPVLTSNDTKSFKTDNSFGIPEKMSAKDCSQFMFGINEQFDNIDSMIEAVENAATNVSKFRAFSIFARDLRNDPSLANAVFSNFAKPKHLRSELRVNGDRTEVVVANPRVNKESSMTFDFMNNIKSSVTMEGGRELMTNQLKEVDTIVKDMKKHLEDDEFDNYKEKAITQLTSIFKFYFPNVEESAIRAYIELNKGAGNNNTQLRENCKNLLKDARALVNEHENSKKLYDTMQSNLVKVREYNRKLDYAKKKQEAFISKDRYLSENDYKNDDYIKGYISIIKSYVTN